MSLAAGGRSYSSAPATRVSSPENIRRFKCAAELQRYLHQVQRTSVSGDYARVAMAEPPVVEPDQGSVVTPQCLLFVVITSLLFLSMTLMMVVVILHFVTGGKLFSSKSPRRNATVNNSAFNFFHGRSTAKAL